MSLVLADLVRLRPFLYHLTAPENLRRIRATRRLESATQLATEGGRADLLGTRRREHIRVTLEEDVVVLRDQAPLYEGNMRLDSDWTFARFVQHLNDRVFFWPGDASGPIAYGQRHFARYEPEQPALLRIRFASLLASNGNRVPEVCRYNSGSPRWSNGIAAPRGGQTFVPADRATIRPAQVVEVTWPGGVELPADGEFGSHPTGPWQPLFG